MHPFSPGPPTRPLLPITSQSCSQAWVLGARLLLTHPGGLTLRLAEFPWPPQTLIDPLALLLEGEKRPGPASHATPTLGGPGASTFKGPKAPDLGRS